MRKHELLVPAGNMECLEQAIANGADAVYVGCKDFGARKFASNFSNDELVKAIQLAHLYGVKIYATMNTLVKDAEVPYFLGQIEFLHKNGIDAVLIQDFGMLCLIREKYPSLEVHASTQANTSAGETAELFYQLGVKRVVFSREMSLEEIENIKVPIEKEVFVHGALCICYSGCCLMSSMIGNRSGNRGECAGSCRLPYSIEYNNRQLEEEKYWLSTKELNSSYQFQQLLDSSIASFKIEGRMKSPEYVGFITKFYRNIIDSYNSNINLKEENDQLKTIFNREFTKGHLFNCTTTELMNSKTPNHIGLEIGKVVEITPQKIKIKLDKELNQQDGIRFLRSGKGFIVNYLYDKDDNLISKASDIVWVDNKINLTEKDVVCKTLDYQLMQQLKKVPARKVPITFKVTAKIGKPFEIIVSDTEHNLQIQGTIVQESINAPIDEFRIRQQLEKLGDTPFQSTSTVIFSDPNIFISIKEINELRRLLISNLMQLRMTNKKEVIIKQVTLPPIEVTPLTGFTATVRTEEQLLLCTKHNFKRIDTQNESLYNKYRMTENIYYNFPRCQLKIKDLLKKKNVVSDYFNFTEKEDLIGNYGLNVMNIYTAYYLYRSGLKGITLSPELSELEMIEFINHYSKQWNRYPSIEIVGYGRIENMIIKDNILNLKENDLNYQLVDQKQRKFPVYYDGRLTHLLNYQNQTLENLETLKKYASIRLDLYQEENETILQIIKKWNN